jgi:hypothetical protein
VFETFPPGHRDHGPVQATLDETAKANLVGRPLIGHLRIMPGSGEVSNQEKVAEKV